MNRFSTSENRTYVEGHEGQRFACDTWHPLPVPPGIVADLYAMTGCPPPSACFQYPTDTHWLVRKPLLPVPEPPKPMTDGEFVKDYLRVAGLHRDLYKWVAEAMTKAMEFARNNPRPLPPVPASPAKTILSFKAQAIWQGDKCLAVMVEPELWQYLQKLEAMLTNRGISLTPLLP